MRQSPPAGTVPWATHAKAWEEYHRHFPGQSAERIADRGGFGYVEIQCLLLGHCPAGCDGEHVTKPNGWEPL